MDIINSEDYFDKCIDLKEPVNIYLGDNRYIKATKIGNVVSYSDAFSKQKEVNMPLGTSRTTATKGTMQQNRAFYAGPRITLPRPAAANRCAPSARRWVSTTDIVLGAQNALP